MGYFSYKIEHDFGLAPNPFGGYCTLAVCKSRIRKNKRLKTGDWIFGLGSKKLKTLNKLIYAMRVDEIITMDLYWKDSRFQYKKPAVNGSLTQMYGDNFYFMDDQTGEWSQINSAHSLINGESNEVHLKRDTDGNNVLISKTFFYLGDRAFFVPDTFSAILCNGRGEKSTSIPETIADQFVEWLFQNYELGIHGDPISWSEHF